MATLSVENQIDAVIHEASVKLDSFIEIFDSLLSNSILNSIRNFRPPERIIFGFQNYDQFYFDGPPPVGERGEFKSYSKNGYYILKMFHNDIGNYLKEKFKGLEWKVEFFPEAVKVDMFYSNMDGNEFNAVRKYSKKIN